MDMVESLRAAVHEAVRATRGTVDEEAGVEAAIVRAFVKYYAGKLKVIPPTEGDEGYSAAIGEWVKSIDVYQEEACVESSELIGLLGKWEREYFRWVWEGGRLFIRNPGTNEMTLSDVNAWWVIQRRDGRRRHPLAPIVEGWVRVVTDGPPEEGWY